MEKVVSVLIFFGLATAHAQDWQKAVVKVISTPCVTQRPRFEGSGVLIQSKNQIYVVTSEHVLIHEDGPRLCHSVLNNEIGEVKVQLKRADYMKGLALFSASSTTTLERAAVNLTNLKNSSLVAGANVTAMGYPVGVSQLQVHHQGRLVSVESSRALVPLVKKMLEVDGVLVEFGFSGGLLIDDKKSAFAGIITHQYLKREQGKPSKTTEIDDDAENVLRSGDLAFVIPPSEVSDWLSETLRKDNMNDWHRRAEAQLNKENEVCIVALCFSLRAQTVDDLLSVGGDGGGVGGDGGGVGGDGASLAPEVLKTAYVRIDPTASSVLRAQTIVDTFLESLRQSLLNGQVEKREIYIPFLKAKDSARLLSFDSLEKFFTLWRRDGLTPVVLKSRSADLSNELQKRNSLARQVAKLAQAQREKATSEEQKNWFGLLRDQVLLVESNLSDSAVIETMLTGGNETFWSAFYERDFDAAVELESALQKLIAVLKN